MITEQYVTFETARLLKEARFEAECSFIIDDDGRKLYRPSQQLAARWLREVHHISIILTPMEDGWMYDLFAIKKYQYIILSKDAGIVTYETAFEKALQEALQLIIKNKRNEKDNVQ